MDTINKRLVQLTNPITVGNVKDFNAPFTFKDWRKNHVALEPSQELLQYNTYLSNWYLNKAQGKEDTITLLQQRFFQFLRQVQVFFSDVDVLKWYTHIDFSNQRDLLIAIPFFAKKLKEIALYYRDVRQYVKDSKLRNSIVGTDISISKNVQNVLINTFTKKQFNNPIIVDSSTWGALPELSAVVDNLRISIIEMYDDNMYFDGALETSLLSAIPLVSEQEATDFLKLKNLTLSASDWMYTTMLNYSDLNNNLLPVNRRSLLKDLLNKTLATDIYDVQALSAAPDQENFSFSLEKGKNFFYWPYGPFKKSAPKYYKPVALSASGLSERGTPGTVLSASDTIFVKTEEGIKGAWLTLYTFSSGISTMQANINTIEDFVFKFPYPDYGLVAVDVPWTKPGLVSNPNFVFLADEDKQTAERSYWDFKSSTVSCVSIKINESTLTDYAKSNREYLFADRVRVWDTIPLVDSSVYSGNINEAWLYEYHTTDLPLSTVNDSIVYWPYTVVDVNVGLPANTPVATSETCSNIPLTNFIHTGMVAGTTPETSDIILKINNIYDVTNTITEGAWLRGTSAEGYNCIYVKQPGFNLKAMPGNFTKFVWTGPNTQLRDIFKNTKHSKDCEFILSPSTIKDTQKCTCKQIYFNSFGHPGSIFDEYNRQADFFALIDVSATEINLDNWVGSDNKDYLQSSDFSWYQTEENLDWGSGIWTNNITLSTGYCYVYKRAEYNDTDTYSKSMPFLRVVHNFEYDKNDFEWVGVIRNSENEWVASSEKTSKMVLYPGNYLNFIHRPYYTYYGRKFTVSEDEIRENYTTVWSNYDYISVNNSYPLLFSLPNITRVIPDEQTPPFDITKVLNMSWSIKKPDNTEEVYKNSTLISFTPQETGVYVVTLTAEVLSDVTTSLALTTDELFTYGNIINPLSSNFFVFSGIPSITAVMPISATESIPLLYTDATTTGYTLNQPLSGWKGTETAKPFWAKGSTDQNQAESVGIDRIFDGECNILTQPAFSDIVFNYDTYLQIINTNKVPYKWIQPVTMLSAGQRIVWNKLEIDITDFNLSANTVFNNKTVVTSATHTPSDIIFEVVVQNKPVEIFYNAIDPLTWTLTLTTSEATDSVYLNLANTLQATQPWLNILNKFKPTIATHPLISNLYSEIYISDYFKPQQLGVTTYISKDTTQVVSSSSGMFSYHTSYPVGGFGLGNNTTSIYTIKKEDSAWLKEPIVSQAGAGNVSKSVYKTYQKFVPYQSFYETSNLNTIGVINPNSKQSPWSDSKNTVWGDKAFKFVNLPGVVNTREWSSKQILKKESVKLDKWSTDIHGNQYGLYKKENEAFGSVWVRTQQQSVKSSYEGLSGVFDNHTSQLYYEDLYLKVEDIEVFVDVMYIKLNNAICFEKLYYNTKSDEIYNNAIDSITYIITPFSNNLQNYNNTKSFANKITKPWYLEFNKKILLAIVEPNLKIHVLEYDIHSNTSKVIYTYEDCLNVESYVEFAEIKTVLFNYDSQLSNFNITIWGHTIQNKKQLFVLTCKYNQLPTFVSAICYIESIVASTDIKIVSNLHFTIQQNNTLEIPINISTEHSFDCILLQDNAIYSNKVITFKAKDKGINYIPFKIVVDQINLYNTITVNVL